MTAILLSCVDGQETSPRSTKGFVVRSAGGIMDGLDSRWRHGVVVVAAVVVRSSQPLDDPGGATY
ncbi:hypothetical protein Ct61P_05792 [Colletotrichum tofieldiae]|nr:hypothetical protein Ct61P_05792 [Colletotrichum tofieldiae]